MDSLISLLSLVLKLDLVGRCYVKLPVYFGGLSDRISKLQYKNEGPTEELFLSSLRLAVFA